MQLVPFKVKAVSLEDLKAQEEGFRDMLDKWVSKDSKRTYKMTINEESLELQIMSCIEDEDN